MEAERSAVIDVPGRRTAGIENPSEAGAGMVRPAQAGRERRPKPERRLALGSRRVFSIPPSDARRTWMRNFSIEASLAEPGLTSSSGMNIVESTIVKTRFGRRIHA